MRFLKRIGCHFSIMATVMLLFCMSAFVVMATGSIETEDGSIVRPGEVEEKKEVQIDSGEVSMNLEAAEEQAKLYTFTIYNNSDNKVGTIEFRYGLRSNYGGRMLWITTDAGTIEISRDKNYFRYDVAGDNCCLTIARETWDSYFKDEKYTYTCSTKVLPSIPAVSDVKWSGSEDPGKILFTTVEEANGRYELTLLCDGEVEFGTITRNNKGKLNYASDINENGTYTVEIVSVGDKTHGDSESVVSEPYIYTAPEERVGNTTKVWWTAKEGEVLPTIINWEPVAGAGGYEISLIAKDKENYTLEYYRKKVYNKEQGLVTSVDWEETIRNIMTEEGEEVTFDGTVRALSGNIEVVANSLPNSSVSADGFEVSDIVGEVKKAIQDATTDNITTVISETGIESVASAMQTDKELLDQIASLEKEYIEKNGITMQEPSVTHEGIDKDSIQIVGAGIASEAVTGGSAAAKVVGVNFSKLEAGEEKEINEKLYENTVQVSITLESNGTAVSGKLTCPVTITMLPPEGVYLDKLVILHYHADGTYEPIYPAKNADGTITFSVTSFSTFVFANLVQYNGDSDDNGDGSDNKPEEGDKPGEDKPGEDNKPGNNDKPSNNNDSSDDSDDSSSSNVSVPIRNTGVYSYNGIRRFVKVDGTYAKSEWVEKGNLWYYAGADSVLLTGWYQDSNGTWYFLKDNCEMATGWQNIGSMWYYLDNINGDMKTGWLQDTNGKWYFLNGNGSMKVGWVQTADGKWYYLGADGACYMDTITPDGYRVDANGAWMP